MYVDKRSQQVFFKPFLRSPLLYHYNLNLRHVGEERGIIISVIIAEDRVWFGYIIPYSDLVPCIIKGKITGKCHPEDLKKDGWIKRRTATLA